MLQQTFRRDKPSVTVMPGDDLAVRVRLQKPVALAEGWRFAVRESNRTVGRGVVTKVIG